MTEGLGIAGGLMLRFTEDERRQLKMIAMRMEKTTLNFGRGWVRELCQDHALMGRIISGAINRAHS